MKKYLSRKDRARRLSNTIQHYIIVLKNAKIENKSLEFCNGVISSINYVDFFKLREEINEIERHLSKTNLIKTNKGKSIAHLCITLAHMEPHQAQVFNTDDLDRAIIRLERFVMDLDSLQFVDKYGWAVE